MILEESTIITASCSRQQQQPHKRVSFATLMCILENIQRKQRRDQEAEEYAERLPPFIKNLFAYHESPVLPPGVLRLLLDR